MPTAAASSRIPRIRSSGSNGLPLTIPIAARSPISSMLVLLPAGSSWTSLVQQLEEAEVARWDRVERHPAAFDELRLGNVRRRIGVHVALEQRPDARTEAALGVGVDLQRALDQLDGRSGVLARVLVDERPAEQDRPRRARVADVVAAVGQGAVVARWDRAGNGRPRRDPGPGGRSRRSTETTCRRTARAPAEASRSPSDPR